MADYRHGGHTLTDIKYHVVWITKYRYKVLQGPMRERFREMAGDPDELDLLDYDKVAAHWDAWHGRFVGHYGLVTARQALAAKPAGPAPMTITS